MSCYQCCYAEFRADQEQGVIRELHWHKEAEWAYVLEGTVSLAFECSMYVLIADVLQAMCE